MACVASIVEDAMAGWCSDVALRKRARSGSSKEHHQRRDKHVDKKRQARVRSI